MIPQEGGINGHGNRGREGFDSLIQWFWSVQEIAKILLALSGQFVINAASLTDICK